MKTENAGSKINQVSPNVLDAAPPSKRCTPFLYPTELRNAENNLVEERRKKVFGNQAKSGERVGLALSGGGIRSATFCLGVLQILARTRMLRKVDFLSTVSG